MKNILGITVKLFLAIQFLAAPNSTARADSFPHCASNDAKCVGELLLYQIRIAGNGGNPGNNNATFCVCETPRNANYCRVNGGSTEYYNKILKLKRIADGSEVSDLGEFYICSATTNPTIACDAALLNNPACH
ncbi:MAG: hypothetical protein NT027_18365 [Proteobacteria bacterium]|nr:hypothetical protein [Pseudomonadota bacterium]